VFTCYRTPEQHLPAANHDSDFGRVYLTMLVHERLDPSAKLRVRWGDLTLYATLGVVIGVHAPKHCKARASNALDTAADLAHSGLIKKRKMVESDGTSVATRQGMAHALSRMLSVAAVGIVVGLSSVSACTRTTDRVLEPVGVGDASAPEPELKDSGLNPLEPIALPPEPPAEDYRLVRAPVLGASREASGRPFMLLTQLKGGDAQVGGSGGSNSGGMAGSDLRPVVSAGGSYY
jgi:hypothetical protein